MARLVFTTDGLICEPASRAAPRVLSRVIERRDGTARLLARGVEHEISPFASPGCPFELRDGDGRRSGGFEPFRLRRGGRLSVGEVALSLCSRPWSHEGWRFSTPQGSDIAATVAVTELDAASNRDDTRGRRAAIRPLVALESSDSLAEPPALASALALGCWLIVRWHSDPVPDHVLGWPPDARALAPGSAGPPAAGTDARAAN
jgi:hypothetical protein